MAKNRKDENKTQRLAKGIRKAEAHARHDAKRKGAARARARGHSRGTAPNARRKSPLARLIQSLGKEKIRFQVVGMTAAVYQGVMLNTMDTDIWIDLPTRQYMRLWNIIRSQGGSAMSQTLYILGDGKVVNFLFEVTGLKSFAAEYRHALTFTMEGLKVKVLPLARILKSKKAIMRDKDVAHIPHIERVLKARKKLKMEGTK
ncbi:MAG TPA: hypothetical protein VGI88_03465 [Verrucomicrobiae bacterium]